MVVSRGFTWGALIALAGALPSGAAAQPVLGFNCQQQATQALNALETTALAADLAGLIAEGVAEAGQPLTNVASVLAVTAQVTAVGTQAANLAIETDILALPECATSFLGDISVLGANDVNVGGDVNATDVNASNGNVTNLNATGNVGSATASVRGASVSDGTATLSGGSLTGGVDLVAAGQVGSATADLQGDEIVVDDGTNRLAVDASGVAIQAGPGPGVEGASVTLSGAEARVEVRNPGGAVHGLVVGVSETRLSGGTSSSSWVLSDDGARLESTNPAATLDVTGHRITNVAPGVLDTDAANVSQLRQVNRELRRDAYNGIASATAIASIPEPRGENKYSLGLGLGTFKSGQALAAGFRADVTQRIRLSGNVAASGDGTIASGVGASFSW